MFVTINKRKTSHEFEKEWRWKDMEGVERKGPKR